MLYDLSHVDYQKPNLQTMVSDSWFSEVEGAGGGIERGWSKGTHFHLQDKEVPGC